MAKLVLNEVREQMSASQQVHIDLEKVVTVHKMNRVRYTLD